MFPSFLRRSQPARRLPETGRLSSLNATRPRYISAAARKYANIHFIQGYPLSETAG